MESQIKSSFIPQDVGKAASTRVRSGDGADLIILFSIIMLVASLTLAGGVFLYTKYLSNSITAKQASIDRARAAIEPALITTLSRLDSRMKSADTLLQSHVSVSAVFALLEQITLQSIQLTDLAITTESPDSITLTLKGVAGSVNSIALQSDLYGKSGIITSPIFSDINRDSNGYTAFRVDALLNPSALQYVHLLNSQNTGVQPGAQQFQVSATSSTQTTGTTGGSGGTTNASSTQQ